MSGKVLGDGTPHRYSEGLIQKEVCCENDAVIIANKVYPSGVEDCRILVVRDCDGCDVEFFKGTLKVCPVEDNKICANGKDFSDYRGVLTQDHVKLVGHVNDCNNSYEIVSLSVFPVEGQTAQELAEAIILLMCATYGAPSNFVDQSGSSFPQPNVKCALLYDRSLSFTNPTRYLGGVLNNTPTVWTDDTIVGNGDVATNFRATLLSLRRNGTDQVGSLKPVSPEWPFGSSFTFAASTVDGDIVNQNVSNWLNTLEQVQQIGVQFEDNAGVVKHLDGDQIDMIIKMEYKHLGVWFEWQGRYGISSYAGNYFTSAGSNETVFDIGKANQQGECTPIEA